MYWNEEGKGMYWNEEVYIGIKRGSGCIGMKRYILE